MGYTFGWFFTFNLCKMFVNFSNEKLFIKKIKIIIYFKLEVYSK